MKYFFFTLAVILLLSCRGRNPQNANNTTKQNELVGFLQKYKNVGYDVANTIQRDEKWHEREDGLVLLQDSLGVFHNIQGQINRIKARDVGDSKVIEFEIKVKPEEYFEITLECSHIVHKDSLEADNLYQLVKSLSEHSTVYADGALAITFKGKVANSSWSDKDIQFSYPKYKFNIVDLSTQPLPEVTNNVKNAIVIWRKSFESILKNSKSAETDKNIDAFKKATESLTPSEDIYMKKYIHACSLDLYRD